jgi:hypothetical protein
MSRAFTVSATIANPSFVWCSDNTLDKTHPTTLVLAKPVIGGGDEEWSVQELHGTGLCKNGKLDGLELFSVY